ncbi:hypothetical protein Sta7437_2014 [Stanieria cyanosphaera PCC 7437]|uniref:Uncharacterized protein n=1 Tax=Stanieria cyanosphaera (strain ATCC 29371 / PCC 7437) TaxID=111780 RepID=K9XU20_STAC7|nr:hypothetical protein [Stanieria cyanosphaera]AFZ35566.1 hypothetical protein Sta7437_2014 [Stanieria cyanosphaera PCC 7437]
MKKICFKVFNSLAIASLTILIGTEATIAADTTSTNKNDQLTPINLVFHGYQGYFTDQGIPSGATFISSVHFGTIDAEQLVKSAIDKGRLAPETINDESFLRKVQASLSLIERRR